MKLPPNVRPSDLLHVLDKLESDAWVEQWERCTGLVVVQRDLENGSLMCYGFSKEDAHVAEAFATLQQKDVNEGWEEGTGWECQVHFMFDPADGPLEEARRLGEERHKSITDIVKRALEAKPE